MTSRAEDRTPDEAVFERFCRVDRGIGAMLHAVAGEDAHRPAVDDGALWRHASRPAGALTELAVERALRGDAALMRRYRAMVAARSSAWSPMAAAAAGGTTVSRRLGDYDLNFSEEGRRLIMTIALPPGVVDAAPPTGIEVFADGDSERLALGAPIRNFITVAFNGERPEELRLFRMLTRPGAAIYLL